MDGVKAKIFDVGQVGEPPAEVSSNDLPGPKKRTTKHKKFIDLQKRPPKSGPLVQE